jgi:hypothetical protein
VQIVGYLAGRSEPPEDEQDPALAHEESRAGRLGTGNDGQNAGLFPPGLECTKHDRRQIERRFRVTAPA